MKVLLQSVVKEVSLIAKVSLIALLVMGGAAFAANFTQPTQSPPNGNVEAPVNVGGTPQAKSGNFAANALAGQWVQGVSGLCIGSDCRTAWPSGSGGGGSEPSCSFDVKTVEQLHPHSDNLHGISQATSPAGGVAGVGSICWGSLTSAAKAEGWVPISFDRCPNISGRDCNDNISYCTYVKLSCTNATVTEGTYTGVVSNSSDITSGNGQGGSGGGGGGGGGGTNVLRNEN